MSTDGTAPPLAPPLLPATESSHLADRQPEPRHLNQRLILWAGMPALFVLLAIIGYVTWSGREQSIAAGRQRTVELSRLLSEEVAHAIQSSDMALQQVQTALRQTDGRLPADTTKRKT